MGSESDSKSTARGRCPICGAPTVHEYRPFCSRRCADVDLSRWLRGAYVIPAQSADDEEDEMGVGEGEAISSQGARQRDNEEL